MPAVSIPVHGAENAGTKAQRDGEGSLEEGVIDPARICAANTLSEVSATVTSMLLLLVDYYNSQVHFLPSHQNSQSFDTHSLFPDFIYMSCQNLLCHNFHRTLSYNCGHHLS